MATSRPTLDAGPPLPQNLQPQHAKPNAAQLAGVQQDAQGGGASLQAQVVQKAMFAEQAINDIMGMLPAASGLSAVVDQFRKVLGSALSQIGQQPQPTPGGLLAGPAGMMAGTQ